MLNFKTRLSRQKFILPWLLIFIGGFLIFISCIICTVFMFNKIGAFVEINWPNGYYTEEFDTFLNSLVNDEVVHNWVKYTCIDWFVWFIYLIVTAIPMLSLTIRRLHDVSKSALYLPISLFFVFKDSDIFENEWGKPE